VIVDVKPHISQPLEMTAELNYVRDHVQRL